MKTLRKVATVFLVFAMVVSSLNFGFVVKAASVEQYKIYPTPQQVDYGTKTMTLTDQVNVVYEENIDVFTKNHLSDVFSKLGIQVTPTAALDSAKTNVLVGIEGQTGAANTYFTEHNLRNNFDFTKYDASILSIKDNTIAILAKDTDAAFHAITSLKHIFTQVQNKVVSELTIRDYADVKSRGFIEGYYGNPWSNEDRADLMRFGGDYKLNNYIYAPKDDPKHNAQWRSLYSEAELAEITKLAQAGNESKCYYVYALHTFMHNPVRFDSNYQDDLKIIQNKFEQLMGAGVKQFAILADDANVPSNNAQHYVTLMRDMTNWMKEKAKTVPGLKTDLIFCPNDYMGMGSSTQMQTLKQLPASVSIIQTGGRVWGEVGPSFNNAFYRNMERPAYMWINWPCSDNTKDSLIMGGAQTVLKPNVNPNTVNGIVLNPMQQSEPSKQGLFTNADYAWNIWDTASKYDSVWNDSFNYIDHGTKFETTGSVAYRELSKHMMNSMQLHNDESFEIKDRLAAFQRNLANGSSIATQAADIRAEFVKLQNAAKDYRAHTGNTRTLNQIIYWIDCWDDTTEAIINFLDCATALEEGNNSKAVQCYLAGQQAAERSRTHKFHYVDHLEKAVVGRLHVTPFMGKLDQLLSTRVEGLIDPTKQIVTFITNRTDVPEGNLKNVLDNDPSTEIIFKTPSNIANGTFVGLSYSAPIDVHSVIFRMGQSGNLEDRFTTAVVEYTNDGKTWKAVNDTTYRNQSEITITNLNLTNVKGIRLKATAYVDNKWLGVRDIAVNTTGSSNPEQTDGKVAGTGIYNTEKMSKQGGELTQLTDGNKSVYVPFAKAPYSGTGKDTTPADAWVGLEFAQPSEIDRFVLEQGSSDAVRDIIKQARLEYTEDGTTWHTIKTLTGLSMKVEVTFPAVTAKKIRIVNTHAEPVWWRVREIEAFKGETGLQLNPTFSVSSNLNNIHRGNFDLVQDHNDQTFVWLKGTNGGNAKIGDYVQLDLGQLVYLNTVHFAQAPDGADYFAGYDFEVSTDGTHFTKVGSYRERVLDLDVTDQNIRARYVRMKNTETTQYWIKIAEFNVTASTSMKASKDSIYTNLDLSNNETISTKLLFDQASLFNSGALTLKPNDYVGLKLDRIKDLSVLEADLTKDDAVVLEVSKNALDWTTVANHADINKQDARYIRYINKGQQDAQLNIRKLVVKSNEVKEPGLHSSTIGINSSWGQAEDTRNNGAAFDGDVNTTTEFADLPQKDQYIIYDLGQTRKISSLEIFCQDSAVNYIRDGLVQISSSLDGTWTTVITIGDGVENTDDAGITCLQSDAGYQASSRYPNKVSKKGTIEAQDARYIRILMTARNVNRAVVFNEIMINNGEYAPVINDPTFKATMVEKQGHNPQKMMDKTLTTSYIPSSKEAGSVTYTLSENLNVNRLNILQKAISNATVEAYVQRDGQRKWVTIGTLSQSFNELSVKADYLLQVRISWEKDADVNISEMIIFRGEEQGNADKSALQNEIKNVPAHDATVYTEASWNAYQAALTKANNVNKNANATQTMVDEAIQELQDAKAGLKAATVLPVSMSATLTDKIGMNIYLDVNDAVKENAYVVFKTADETVEPVRVNLNTLTVTNGLYKVTMPLYARQMADVVTMEVHANNQTTTYTYSIGKYAEKVLAQTSLDAKAKALVEAMLNYGATVQTYFTYNTENLANKNVENKAYTAVTAADLAPYKSQSAGSVDGVRYVASNLRLLSETAVRLHFLVDESVSRNKNIKFYIVDAAGQETKVTPEFYGGDKVFVEVQNIYATKLDTPYTVKVTNNATNEELTVTYSALSYAEAIMNKETASQGIKDVVKAMYVYNQTAKAYQAQ